MGGKNIYRDVRFFHRALQLSPPLPSSLTSVKPANPGSSGEMAVKTKTEMRSWRSYAEKMAHLWDI